MPFRPEINQTLRIDEVDYCFTEHPAAPGMPYGQTGRRATVYQVQADGAFHALKIFTPAFRSPRVAQTAARLQSFATLPGLQVCDRTVLKPEHHHELLAQQPDLVYSVLMPWVAGETWQELLLGRQPFTPEQSLALARAFANILATMENQGLAHCDLSGSNLIVNPSTPIVTLVDVEELYAPGLARPEKLPGGSEGYAHKTAPKGLWSAEADRFAGAVLLVEMLSWCDDNIRQIAYSEQVFDPAEMQQNSERYQRLLAVLRERWGEAIADTFARAWHGETLADCPTLATWTQHLAALQEITTVRLMLQSNSVPDEDSSKPRASLVRSKISAAEAWLELDEADKALAESGEAMRLAPQIAAPVHARAFLKRATQKESRGELESALADYRAALSVSPDGELRDELKLIVVEIQNSLHPSGSEEQIVTSTCPQCRHQVQAEWLRCPNCGSVLRKQSSLLAKRDKGIGVLNGPWMFVVLGIALVLLLGGIWIGSARNARKRSLEIENQLVLTITIAPALIVTEAPVSTVTDTPTAVPPTFTPTQTSTSTPTATNTPQPPTSTYTPVPVSPPSLVIPAPGQTYPNPLVFQWTGRLYGTQRFQVRAKSLRTGAQVQSQLSTSTSWKIDFSPETYGEWSWRVYVIDNGQVVAQSPEVKFWFNPFTGSESDVPTPPRR